MALSIKNRELEETARELALVAGTSITDALLVSAKRELRRLRDLQSIKSNDSWERIKAIQREYAALPDHEPKLTEDEVLGYDEFGIPTQ